MDEATARVRIASMVCLTIIAVTAIVGDVIVATLTDRSSSSAHRFLALSMLVVALLGGLSVLALRRHKWRLEREDINGSSATATAADKESPTGPSTLPVGDSTSRSR